MILITLMLHEYAIHKKNGKIDIKSIILKNLNGNLILLVDE